MVEREVNSRLEALEKLDLAEEEKRKIRWENAERILAGLRVTRRASPDSASPLKRNNVVAFIETPA